MKSIAKSGKLGNLFRRSPQNKENFCAPARLA
jgi:hypothetical protein